MAIGLPKIKVSFVEEGISAIKRGANGIVALILKDTKAGNYTVFDIDDIPEELKEENKKYIELTLLGNTNAPTKVEVYTLASDGNLSDALNYLESVNFNYLAYPDVEESDKASIKAWVEKVRKDFQMVKAVLSGTGFDSEAIINFTTEDIKVGDKTYSSKEYCCRIAGLLAGTDLKQSATHAVLEEVDDIPFIAKSELESKIGQGELVLYKQYGKVKIARAVTSLKTTSDNKVEKFKKIKISDIADLVVSDIVRVSNEEYIGKLPNDYDSKCLLITAISQYFEELAKDRLIEKKFTVGLDLEVQKKYIKSLGVDVSKLTDKEIKEYNTKDKVFLRIKITILDAIEELELRFSI